MPVADASTVTASPAALTSDLPPLRISEVVLRTAKFDAMKEWYQRVLGTEPSLEMEREHAGDGKVDNFHRLCFLRIQFEYPYTQVIAIFDVKGVAPSAKASGLHHMQIRQAGLDTLLTRYERLRSIGIVPYESYNHGPATSFYYEDPDGNLVELNAPNFKTQQEYLAYFATPAFKKNPAGVLIDADAFVARHRAGVPLEELVKMPA